jgi:hypothetical protein
MRVLRISLQFAAFVMLFLFISCTSTKFSAIWKDETYQERPRKILVINALNNPATRRLFENELVKALKDRNIDAIVSYTIMSDQMVSDKNPIATQANTVGNMPDPIVSDKITIAARALAVHADTVLISKPRGSEIDETTNASYINMQTDIYDMKSNRLVLTVLAEIWIPPGEPYDRIIQSYIKDFVNELSQLGLF